MYNAALEKYVSTLNKNWVDLIQIRDGINFNISSSRYLLTKKQVGNVLRCTHIPWTENIRNPDRYISFNDAEKQYFTPAEKHKIFFNTVAELVAESKTGIFDVLLLESRLEKSFVYYSRSSIKMFILRSEKYKNIITHKIGEKK